MAAPQSIHDLGLGQPVASTPTNTAEQTTVPRQTDEPSAAVSNDIPRSDPPVQELPTTNPKVHVVLTNPPPTRPRSQTDSMSLHPSSAGDTPANGRSRADTNASTMSSVSSRSFATSTTSTTGTSDADDDEDDYDPAQGGDEKSCIKEKRVKEWTKRFHPGSGEELLCTHGCALVIEIMIHGRMYLSNKRICFRSNILGVRTKREIPLKHIHAIVLKNVAGMIPNSFEVHCNDKKYQFTTLPDRDHVLRILMRYWKQENPQVFSVFTDKHPEFTQYLEGSVTPGLARKDSVVTQRDSVAASPVGGEKAPQPSEQSDERKDPGNGGGPRAATKADTNDLEKLALDTILPSEPEKIYKLLYHNDEFLQGIWKEEGFKGARPLSQPLQITPDAPMPRPPEDIQMQPWSNGRREFQYARPVGSIGSTTCVSSEEIVHPEGQDEWFCVEGKTQTPGVPSGKSFATRSKTVFTWAEGGGTKMHVTFQVDWTGKSMLKGTINSQSVSGQKHWNGLLAKKIRAYVQAHPDEFPVTKGASGAVAGGTDDDPADVGAGEEGAEARAGGGEGQEGARDPMESLARQQEILLNEGPIAYLLDDPVRAALLILVTLFLVSWFFGVLKRLLWTGKVVSVPRSRLSALEGAEEELRRLVGDVRAHLKRTTRAAVREVRTTGVVGGAGPVVKRTAIPEL